VELCQDDAWSGRDQAVFKYGCLSVAHECKFRHVAPSLRTYIILRMLP
jgi:hypothetical protein